MNIVRSIAFWTLWAIGSALYLLACLVSPKFRRYMNEVLS